MATEPNETGAISLCAIEGSGDPFAIITCPLRLRDICCQLSPHDADG